MWKSMPLVSTVFLASVILVDQVADLPISVWQQVTLQIALIVAVIALWRSNTAKDSLIVKYTELITASLSSQASSSAELRKVIEESITSSRDTIIVLEKLALRIDCLPCTVSDPIDGSRTKIEPSRIRHAGG